MSSMSNTLENKLIDHVLRGTQYTAPTSLDIALFLTDPTDADTGTEVTGSGYARLNVARADATWKGTHGSATGPSSGTNGTVSNAIEFEFTAPTGNWGVVTHFAIYDNGTGDLLFHAPLTTSKTINNGDDAPKFVIDAMTAQIDN